MIAFMADMLVPEYMTVHLDFISEIVLLVIDLRISFMLRSEVWCENPVALRRCFRSSRAGH
jgi:hypothetical protein